MSNYKQTSKEDKAKVEMLLAEFKDQYKLHIKKSAYIEKNDFYILEVMSELTNESKHLIIHPNKQGFNLEQTILRKFSI